MAERGQPDLVVALALVHHVSITANVPLRDVVDWLSSLGGAVLLEFPTREDPMVQALLSRKRAGLHRDYTIEQFESCLADAFDIHRREELGSGTRVLYFGTPVTRRADR
jgi:hypothetical protein